MNHQIVIIACDDCHRDLIDGKEIDLIRRSHHWSLWCEHSVTDDWYPGTTKPILFKIRGT